MKGGKRKAPTAGRFGETIIQPTGFYATAIAMLGTATHLIRREEAEARLMGGTYGEREVPAAYLRHGHQARKVAVREWRRIRQAVDTLRGEAAVEIMKWEMPDDA